MATIEDRLGHIIELYKWLAVDDTTLCVECNNLVYYDNASCGLCIGHWEEHLIAGTLPRLKVAWASRVR